MARTRFDGSLCGNRRPRRAQDVRRTDHGTRGAVGNAVGQLISLAAGKSDHFSLASMWVSAFFGAFVNGLGGLLGPGSARWLADPHVVERFNLLVMSLFVFPLLFGIAEWAVQLMIAKQSALDAAMDEEQLICVPVPAR